MPGVDWRFPALLFGALVLGALLTYIQMRAYNFELNRALHRARGEHLMLVSGKGRSFRGGAIVIAIVDTDTREIVWARAMTGATVFARFRDVPGLVGPMATAVDRVEGKQFKAAVEMALAQARPVPVDPELAAPARPPVPEVPTGPTSAGRPRPQTQATSASGPVGAPAEDATPRLVRKRVPPPTQ